MRHYPVVVYAAAILLDGKLIWWRISTELPMLNNIVNEDHDSIVFKNYDKVELKKFEIEVQNDVQYDKAFEYDAVIWLKQFPIHEDFPENWGLPYADDQPKLVTWKDELRDYKNIDGLVNVLNDPAAGVTLTVTHNNIPVAIYSADWIKTLIAQEIGYGKKTDS